MFLGDVLPANPALVQTRAGVLTNALERRRAHLKQGHGSFCGHAMQCSLSSARSSSAGTLSLSLCLSSSTLLSSPLIMAALVAAPDFIHSLDGQLPCNRKDSTGWQARVSLHRMRSEPALTVSMSSGKRGRSSRLSPSRSSSFWRSAPSSRLPSTPTPSASRKACLSPRGVQLRRPPARRLQRRKWRCAVGTRMSAGGTAGGVSSSATRRRARQRPPSRAM